MSGAPRRAKAVPVSETRAVTTDGATCRLTADVHRRLLTIQYQQKMAGTFVSFSEIIEQLLDRAGAA